MKTAIISLAIATALPGAFAQAAIASNPVVEISGRITKVGLERGQGMPSLEVKTVAGATWKVWLGSMRYLVEQNFNPKAGQEVSVKGFKQAGQEVTASSATLTETKQTIRLRDESGRPVWRGGFRGRGR
jgi:hypothetical protein